MRRAAIAALSIWVSLAVPITAFAAPPTDTPISGGQALRLLLEGNNRFAQGKPLHPNQDATRRTALAAGQHPVAAVLSCSDSRVPPTVVFDQGLGDLFVVRVAGNTADALGRASLDYAVKHLGARLIVVLGHERCGAVAAAIKEYASGDPGPMLRPIRPAVTLAKHGHGDTLSNAIDENVKLVVEGLKRSPEFAAMVKDGELKIVGARYDFQTGRVRVLNW
jgi:carbonic anhydrase